MQGRWIDVREYPEFAAGHIDGSELVPLGSLGSSCALWDRKEQYTLVCKSGRRAKHAQDELAAKGFQHLTVLPGGVEQWTATGNPLVVLARRPWSIERQVRVVAGGLVLFTMALALIVTRYFFIATACVGAGLFFAGLSDICLMAFLLGCLPWNRQTGRPA